LGSGRVCGTQGYDARFDKEIIVEIEKGHVLKMVVLDLVERSLVVESNVKMQVAEQPKAARMMLATNKSRLRRSA
jgi:molybdopterin-binding protein